jgi:hypothetical protein
MRRAPLATRHFRRRDTKGDCVGGIVGPQETLLSSEGLDHQHRYCGRPQADHVFELRDAVSLNFDLLFTSLQQPALTTNCFFLNANLACFNALRSTTGTLISGILGVRSRAFAN